MRYARWLTLLAALVVAGGAAAPASADPLPVRYGNGPMLEVARNDWNAAVPGADDFTCRPTGAHPKPVVLVGSTFLSAAVNWTALAPYLSNRGYCVFTLNYGRTMYPIPPGLTGMDPIPVSAKEVGALVERVRTATGAARVDLVGHSQGGVVARYYINELGGAAVVDSMTLLSSPYELTGLPVSVEDVAAQLIPRQLYDAVLYNGVVPPFPLNLLDPWSVGRTTALRPHIRYTQITGRADELGAFGGMRPPPGATTSYIDDLCPTDFSQHFAQPYSPTAVAMIGNALDPDHPIPPPCTVVPLYRFDSIPS